MVDLMFTITPISNILGRLFILACLGWSVGFASGVALLMFLFKDLHVQLIGTCFLILPYALIIGQLGSMYDQAKTNLLNPTT